MIHTFDLTPVSGRMAGIKLWRCRRFGHKPTPAVMVGYWTPAPGRVLPKPVAGNGTLCARCNVWIVAPDWPAFVNPADTDVVGPDLWIGAKAFYDVDHLYDYVILPATRHR